MADLQSKVTKAQWRGMTEKLREICHHLRHCRECGETDVMNCPEGRVLWLDQFFEDGRSAPMNLCNCGWKNGSHDIECTAPLLDSQSDAKEAT